MGIFIISTAIIKALCKFGLIYLKINFHAGLGSTLLQENREFKTSLGGIENSSQSQPCSKILCQNKNPK